MKETGRLFLIFTVCVFVSGITETQSWSGECQRVPDSERLARAQTAGEGNVHVSSPLHFDCFNRDRVSSFFFRRRSPGTRRWRPSWGSWSSVWRAASRRGKPFTRACARCLSCSTARSSSWRSCETPWPSSSRAARERRRHTSASPASAQRTHHPHVGNHSPWLGDLNFFSPHVRASVERNMFTRDAFTVHSLHFGTRLQTSQVCLDHAFPTAPLEYIPNLQTNPSRFFLAETSLKLGASRSCPESATIRLIPSASMPSAKRRVKSFLQSCFYLFEIRYSLIS